MLRQELWQETDQLARAFRSAITPFEYRLDRENAPRKS
jgi:hypothetical protein